MRLRKILRNIVLAPLSLVLGVPVSDNAGNTNSANNTKDLTSNEGNQKQFVLGNRFLSRTFTISDNKLRTTSIRNKRMVESFVPFEGSKDFEIGIITDYGPDTISSNNLNVMTFKTEDIDGGDGKVLRILYHPFEVDNVEWTVQLVITLKKDDFFMQKHLEIFVPKGKRKYARIDYIDLEHIEIPQDTEFTWSRPDMPSANMSGFHLSLGQPIYIQGLFLGCTFPATDNRILNNTAFIRYYSGKSFNELPLNDDGAFVTWDSVLGAAQDNDYNTVQKDFFEYIDSFAQKPELKIQYSTLYTKKGHLDANTTFSAFMDAEHNLTDNYISPIDSYVVDEGWNDYNSGFWKFNNKFPNGLKNLTKTANSLASDLGLWFSPCGGYEKSTRAFSQRMVRDGFGNYNSETKNLCVSSEKYINNIKGQLLPELNEYSINCWKIDGFALSPCKSEFHGHAFGGYEEMYSVTEIWEKWIGIFETLHQIGTNKGKKVCINLISFVNLSPWLLRWVDCIWLQNGVDVDFLEKSKNKKKLGGSDGDALLSYRDEQYFDFAVRRAFQFPLSHVYNNDPIYSTYSNLDMRENAFRKYLYMSVVKGSSVFEMCYTPEKLNDPKWMITADAISFAKQNYDILKNAKFFGSSPLENAGVYGYSAWNNGNGIVALRNPSNRTQTFKLVLDESIGVTDESQNLCRYKILPYSNEPFDNTKYKYGSIINLSLNPYEIVIWKFSSVSVPRAKLLSAKVISKDTIRLDFSEHITAVKKSFYVDGYTIKSVKLLANYKTVEITVTKPFIADSAISLEINNVIDLSDSVFSSSIRLKCYKDNVINIVRESASLKNNETIQTVPGCKKGSRAFKMDGLSHKVTSTGSFGGSTDFCLSFLIRTIDTASQIIRQGSEYAVMLNNSGELLFSVKGNTVISNTPINDGEWHYICVLREKNGMLKIYIDGKLNAGSFNKHHLNEYIYHDIISIGDLGFNGILDCVILENAALSYTEIMSRSSDIFETEISNEEIAENKGQKVLASVFSSLITLSVLGMSYVLLAFYLGLWPFK